MKIALDPYMLRSTPLLELPGVVADLGYEYIELSPREDFTPFFLHPRADDGTVKAFKKALDGAGVKIAAHLPLYRWSGPDEDERQAAVRYWKRAIQMTVDLDCHVMNSEFNGRPEAASLSEGQFWKSMEELLRVLGHEPLRTELGVDVPHAGDLVEVDVPGDLVRVLWEPHAPRVGGRAETELGQVGHRRQVPFVGERAAAARERRRTAGYFEVGKWKLASLAWLGRGQRAVTTLARV